MCYRWDGANHFVTTDTTPTAQAKHFRCSEHTLQTNALPYHHIDTDERERKKAVRKTTKYQEHKWIECQFPLETRYFFGHSFVSSTFLLCVIINNIITVSIKYASITFRFAMLLLHASMQFLSIIILTPNIFVKLLKLSVEKWHSGVDCWYCCCRCVILYFNIDSSFCGYICCLGVVGWQLRLACVKCPLSRALFDRKNLWIQNVPSCFQWTQYACIER